MTTSLSDRLALGKLRAAPGTLLALSDGEELSVALSTSHAAGTKPRLETEADLESAGIVVKESRSRLRLIAAVHDWNRGWPMPDASAPRLLVTPDRVLLLPPSEDRSELRLLTARFLGSLPPSVATILLEVIGGRATLLDVSPSREVEARLHQTLTADTAMPLVVTASSVDPVSLDDLSGPLAPAIRIECRRVGEQFVAQAPVLPSIGAIGGTPMTAVGVRSDREQACIVSAGEAAERHTAGVIPAADLVHGSFADLPGAIPPDRVIAFTRWQYDKHHDLALFDPKQRRVWVRARTVAGEPRLVLSDLVFYPFGGAMHRLHASATSSGMAAHTTVRIAVATAWAELAERDAFMRHWLARRPGCNVVVRRPPAPYATMQRDLVDGGWEVHLIQLRGSRETSALCAVVQRRGMLVIGASAGEPQTAAVAALREAWLGIAASSEKKEVPEIEEVRSPADHFCLYRWGGFGGEVAFLLEGDETVDLSQLPPFSSPPGEAVVYEWPAGYCRPFIVTRVLDTDLIPMTFGFEREPLGRHDVKLLLAESGRDGHALMPHPFG
jgi:hypothetical protein